MLPALAVLVACPPPYCGYHRYRGTVGGRPVTVESTIGSTEALPRQQLTCMGSYYCGRANGGLLNLSAEGTYQPRQPLQLQETAGGKATGTWQATQPAGPRLSGTWRSPGGKQVPFSLREDYTDGQGHLAAVRYEMLTTAIEPPCRPERLAGETEAEYRAHAANAPTGYSQQFLHLLGPDTLRPTLRALQCPRPGKRRQSVRTAARKNGSCTYHEATLHVDYDDYGLLAWSEYVEDDFEGGARPAHGTSATVYDLRSGRILSLDDVFQPSTDTLLQSLITRHVLQGDNPDIKLEPGTTMPAQAADMLPLSGDNFSAADDGLEFGYNLDGVPRFITGGSLIFSVLVPWAELLPLLRPDTPGARMLRERELWRADGKKSR